MDALARFVVWLLVPVTLWLAAWAAGYAFSSQPPMIGDRTWLNFGGFLRLGLFFLKSLVYLPPAPGGLFCASWWPVNWMSAPLKAPFFFCVACLLWVWPRWVWRGYQPPISPESPCLNPAQESDL